MLKIGLTGGIGSGKSVVAKMFSVLNVPVFDADKEARVLMEADDELIAQVKQSFGHAVYEGRILNRSYLASIVFNDAYQLEKLNALVHPATIKRAEAWFTQFDVPYVVKEAAIMFEAGSAANLDYVIGVTAPVSLRIRRAMSRDGITRDEVLARMNKQMDDNIKMKLCDFVIVNDEQQSVIEQVLHLHKIFSTQSQLSK